MTIFSASSERFDNGSYYPTVHLNLTSRWIKDPHNCKPLFLVKKEPVGPGDPYARGLEIATADILELEKIVQAWLAEHGYQEFDFINRNFKTPAENAASPPIRQVHTAPTVVPKTTKDAMKILSKMSPEDRAQVLRSLTGK